MKRLAKKIIRIISFVGMFLGLSLILADYRPFCENQISIGIWFLMTTYCLFHLKTVTDKL